MPFTVKKAELPTEEDHNENKKFKHRKCERIAGVWTFGEEHEEGINKAKHPNDVVKASIREGNLLENAVITIEPEASPPQGQLVEVVVNLDIEHFVVHKGRSGVQSVSFLAVSTVF